MLITYIIFNIERKKINNDILCIVFFGEGVTWSGLGGPRASWTHLGPQRDPTRMLRQRYESRLYIGHVLSHTTCYLYGKRVPRKGAL